MGWPGPPYLRLDQVALGPRVLAPRSATKPAGDSRSVRDHPLSPGQRTCRHGDQFSPMCLTGMPKPTLQRSRIPYSTEYPFSFALAALVWSLQSRNALGDAAKAVGFGQRDQDSQPAKSVFMPGPDNGGSQTTHMDGDALVRQVLLTHGPFTSEECFKGAEASTWTWRGDINPLFMTCTARMTGPCLPRWVPFYG
jgi:hypothetical protein